MAASYDFEPPVTVIHPLMPLSAANDIPQQVIDHAVQTRQRILLTARTGYGNFASDPYFRLNQPASLLCVPLKWDTRVEGTLYLEGGTFVFSEVQVQTAEMLAAQTAIALINIQRHEALRQKAEEQQRAEEMLRVISAGTAAVTGEDFFRSLVLHLIEVLHVHSAFITECTDETMERVRTLVFWNDNSFTDNIEYDLEDTTCEGVIAGSVCYYSARVYELFPKEEGVESYLGVPVHNSAGEILDHLAIYDIKPMPEQLEPYKLAILQIFAARAGAELDRIRALDALYQAKEGLEIRVMERTAELTGINARLQGEIVERERAEAALRQSEEAYRDLYEEAPNAYLSVGVDRRIRKANRQAVTYFGYPLSELLDRHILDLIADTPAGRSLKGFMSG